MDQRHADHDARNHSHRRHRVAERNRVLPFVRDECGRHSTHRAVATLETKFQQIAERGIDIEHGNEQEARDTNANRVLSPHDNLRQRQLRQNEPRKALQLRDGNPQEERREDDVDQEPGKLAQCIRQLGRHPGPTDIDDQQPQQTAHDCRRKVESLQEGNLNAEDLADDQ